jgi:hypothetical protein
LRIDNISMHEHDRCYFVTNLIHGP